MLALPLHHMKKAHVTTNEKTCVDVITAISVRNFVGWIEYLVAHRVPPISVALSGDDVSKHTTVTK